MKIQSYQVKRAGNLKNIQLIDSNLEPPGPGEVQVRVKTIGLNFADIFAILGLYSATPKGSFIPGLEYCGVIERVGTGVRGFSPGDCVMGVTRFGGYTTGQNIAAEYITPLPESWTFEAGAGYLVQGLTAYYALFYLGQVKPGDTVLIHSAAGGVGLLANRMAKKKGAYTIGTVGSASKIDLLKQEGYDEYIVRGKRFKKQLTEALGNRELNIVMECIGGSVFQAGYELLAPQGRVVNYGSARYGSRVDSPDWLRLVRLYLTRPKIDPQKMIETNRAVMGFNLIWLYHKKELMRKLLNEMDELELPPPLVGHTFDFHELPEALRLFQSGQTTGKVVIRYRG